MGDSDEEEEKKLIGVRVTDSRREEWKEFVEESSEYGSMAQLIRASVERTINKDESELDEKVDMLMNSVEYLIDEMHSIVTIVNDVPERVDDAEEIAEEVVFLQKEIERNDGLSLEEIDSDDGGDEDGGF